MEKLVPNNPIWHQTFPHLLTPLPDEWLPGLLLRCDEVNHWRSRTTLAYVLSTGTEKFHRCWRTPTPNLVVIQPFSLPLDSLAEYLALPTNVLLATTYHLELMRLYGPTQLYPKLLNASFAFHLCPACLAEARLLQRTLTLPHLTLCHKHRIMLLAQCQCGTVFHLFHRQTQPFTCHICGGDWAKLPQIKATPSHLAAEQQFLAWYAFFFSQGTPLFMQAAQQLMTGSMHSRLPLGTLVTLLVQRGRSPQNILNRADRISQMRAKRMSSSPAK